MAIAIIGMGLLSIFNRSPKKSNSNSVHEFTMKDIDEKEIDLSIYKGKVLVIVNVASKCGLTPQYESLQAFYEQYQSKGVEILGFPANNFLGQEPGTEEEIKDFCSINYKVNFPMFSKISVKGKDQDPLYTYLTVNTDEQVSWNFQKFVVGKDGKVIAHIPPRQKINEQKSIDLIERALAK